MGLADIKKRVKDVAAKDLADSFIAGADTHANQHAGKPVSKAKAKSYLFSMTHEVNLQIEAIALSSKTKRLSRSDVVRLGIAALANMSEDEINTHINNHLEK